MARFTITDLRQGIAKINEWLESEGALVRFIEQGRNGYQAVDEYPVDAWGKRIGSGVNRMVGSGTSREAYNEAYTAYQHVVANIHRQREKELLKRVEELEYNEAHTAYQHVVEKRKN